MVPRPLSVLAALVLAAMAILAARTDDRRTFHCAMGRVAAALPTVLRDATARAAVPSSSPPIRHSRPGLSRVIYLDFTGETVSGTWWNSKQHVASWTCLPYNRTGSSSTTFSDQEQADIIRIWERVSEDYAPFAVDVTTEAPAAGIASASATTAWVLITAERDASNVALPHLNAGGVAIVDCFGDSNNAHYAPAWVNGTMEPEDIADAASHEVGHNLGLSHDGTASGLPYYYGHTGGGVPSWGPIMGAPYGMQLAQWSKGEYFDANNTEDDLAIIAGKLTYATDDHGDDFAHATALTLDGSGNLAATGIIGHTGDIDMFSVTVPTDGSLSLAVAGYRDTGTSEGTGGNLDLGITLFDSVGTVLASDDPALSDDALTSHAVSSGTYYIAVAPVGAGTPLADPPSGYTDYGTLGGYSLSGALTTGAPLVSDSSASGAVGVPLSVDPDAVGATGFSAIGLPPGLAISATSGRITGTPTTSGSYAPVITGTNGSGSDTGTISFTIAPLPDPTVNDGSAIATVGTAFSRAVSSSLVSDFSAINLPTGLSIHPTSGVISGTPSASGTFTATVIGSNPSGSDTGAYTFVVSPAPAHPAASSGGGGGGSACGSGSGIALLLGLFALAFVRRR